MEGSGYRNPPSLVRRADGQVIQLTPLLYEVLAAVDGRRTHAGIAEVVSGRTGRRITPENVATLVEQQLLPLGFLRLADGSQPQVKKANPLLALRFRYVVTNPEITRRVTAPFARLFHPALVTVLVGAFLGVCWWVLFEKGLASATHEALYQPGMLLIVFAVTVLSAGFHEFGHAAAARYGGSTPGVMGMGLYLVWPAFYTDVTDSYRLGRAGRVRTDLGGLYFNAIVAVAMLAVWWAVRWDALLLVIATQILQMLRQLAPLVRFDGYHVLADLTGVPDLYHHIKPTLLGLLPQNWGRPENQTLKPWARAVVSTWVLLVVPLLLGSLVLMVLALPRVAATAADSLARQAGSFGTAFGEGDVLGMATGLLSMVALALPLFGMAYILLRLVRRLVTSVWTRTEGRPGRRGVAVATALAVLAGLAWAWWPDEGTYRPIQAYERGTLADAVPLAAPSGLQEGSVARARTVWTGGELPTPERPSLAVVMVPRDPGAAAPAGGAGSAGTDPGSGTPPEGGLTGDQAWVFPFDRPAAPAEGDNQALAVNTTDGSTVYDVAFALVWAEGPVTGNVNEAYAVASCQACTTVAVAFQVVLVVGQSDTIVPQNLAAAVSYQCIECVTHALATQLVYTLDGPLSDDAMGRLSRLWAEIAAYGQSLEGIPLTEIRAALSDYEAQIVRIIEGEQPPGPSTGPSTEPSPGGSPGPSGSPPGGPSSSPSGRTSPSGGASPSAATGASPSAVGSPTTSGAPGAGPGSSPTGGSSPTAGASTSPTTGPSTSPGTRPQTSSSPSPAGTATGTTAP